MNRNKAETKRKTRINALNNEFNVIVESGPLTVYDITKNDPESRKYSAHHSYVKELESKNRICIHKTETAQKGKPKYFYGPTKYGILIYLSDNLSTKNKTSEYLSKSAIQNILKVIERWSDMFPSVFKNWESLIQDPGLFSANEEQEIQSIHQAILLKKNQAIIPQTFGKIWMYYCFLVLRNTANRAIQLYEIERYMLPNVFEPGTIGFEDQLSDTDFTDLFFTVFFDMFVLLKNASVQGDNVGNYMGNSYIYLMEKEAWKGLFVNWLSTKKAESEELKKWINNISDEYHLSI